MPVAARTLMLKAVGLVFTLGSLNVILVIFFPEAYTDFPITLLLINLFIAVDYLARPLFSPSRKDQYKTRFLMLFLFAIPFLVTLPYLEHTFILRAIIPPEVTWAFWMLGTLMITLGGITLDMSRIILGGQGSLKIGTEKDHKLITKGPYHVIRHPIYAGTLFLLLGYSLSFSSIIGSIILILILVPLGRSRMALEEKLLIQTFGDEYLNYMKRTKRLIPFIY